MASQCISHFAKGPHPGSILLSRIYRIYQLYLSVSPAHWQLPFILSINSHVISRRNDYRRKNGLGDLSSNPWYSCVVKTLDFPTFFPFFSKYTIAFILPTREKHTHNTDTRKSDIQKRREKRKNRVKKTTKKEDIFGNPKNNSNIWCVIFLGNASILFFF